MAPLVGRHFYCRLSLTFGGAVQRSINRIRHPCHLTPILRTGQCIAEQSVDPVENLDVAFAGKAEAGFMVVGAFRADVQSQASTVGVLVQELATRPLPLRLRAVDRMGYGGQMRQFGAGGATRRAGPGRREAAA